MTCQVTVDTTGLTSTPFGSGAPGGRVFGSLRLKASCEDAKAQAELQLDESDTGIVASIVKWLGGAKLYNKPEVVDSTGAESGSVTIESVWRIDAAAVGVQLNISTSSNGAQTFDLDYKCRCQPPGGNWTRGSATVSFSV